VQASIEEKRRVCDAHAYTMTNVPLHKRANHWKCEVLYFSPIELPRSHEFEKRVGQSAGVTCSFPTSVFPEKLKVEPILRETYYRRQIIHMQRESQVFSVVEACL
jgi:hypothetical protein